MKLHLSYQVDITFFLILFVIIFHPFYKNTLSATINTCKRIYYYLIYSKLVLFWFGIIKQMWLFCTIIGRCVELCTWNAFIICYTIDLILHYMKIWIIFVNKKQLRKIAFNLLTQKHQLVCWRCSGTSCLRNIFLFYVAGRAIKTNWISEQYFPIETMCFTSFHPYSHFSN